MRGFSVAAVLSWIVTLGCATPETIPIGPAPDWKLASASTSVGNDLQGGGGVGRAFSVQVDNRNVTGPRTKLYVGGGTIQGTSDNGNSVQLSVQGDKAQGLVGGAPFTCVVDTNPDGSAHVTGTMGGRSTDFNISRKQLNGRIAGFTYNLTWAGDRYENRMDPGGFAYVSLPAVLPTWTNTEVACVLSVLLT
jgi:hypothetical protein